MQMTNIQYTCTVVYIHAHTHTHIYIYIHVCIQPCDSFQQYLTIIDLGCPPAAMIRFCTFWVLLFFLACCLLQQALRKTLQVSLVAPSLSLEEASERVERSSSTEHRDDGSAGSQASQVQGEVRARGARVSVSSCHGCRGGSFGDLSTLKASGPLQHVVVSMASRDVDVLAFLVLARSLRAAGRFSGDIVLMWFGDPKKDISCRHKKAMEELHFRVVCVRQPLCETEIHSSVTGRSWDWVKLLAFTLTGFDLGVFLDVDMMAVRQTDELWGGLGAGSAQTQLAFVDGPKSLLNSGIFRISPQHGRLYWVDQSRAPGPVLRARWLEPRRHRFWEE